MNRTLAVLCFVTRVALPADPVTVSLRDLTDNPQTLQQYRGRVVVLNFWATWCVPCREEMPLLVDIQNRYSSRGVVVVGASADDETTRDQIKPFIDKLRINFPIWTGATTAQMERLGLGTALPATAIIDQQGQIAFHIIGVLERKDLKRRLDYLLAGSQGKAPEAMIDTLSKDHEHGEEEEHTHGGVGVEGASMVPS